MNIDTKELLNKLTNAPDISRFIEEYGEEFLNVPLLDYLTGILAAKEISVADVARKSGQGEYVYKIFQGKRKPSRDVLTAIAVGMGLNVDETQFMLRIANFARLDPRNKRDSIILYSIKEGYEINRTNDLLFELDEPTL